MWVHTDELIFMCKLCIKKSFGGMKVDVAQVIGRFRFVAKLIN